MAAGHEAGARDRKRSLHAAAPARPPGWAQPYGWRPGTEYAVPRGRPRMGAGHGAGARAQKRPLWRPPLVGAGLGAEARERQLRAAALGWAPFPCPETGPGSCRSARSPSGGRRFQGPWAVPGPACGRSARPPQVCAVLVSGARARMLPLRAAAPGLARPMAGDRVRKRLVRAAAPGGRRAHIRRPGPEAAAQRGSSRVSPGHGAGARPQKCPLRAAAPGWVPADPCDRCWVGAGPMAGIRCQKRLLRAPAYRVSVGNISGARDRKRPLCTAAPGERRPHGRRPGPE